MLFNFLLHGKHCIINSDGKSKEVQIVFTKSHCLGISYSVDFLVGLGSNEFHTKWRFGTHGSWKNQNPGGRFGATS